MNDCVPATELYTDREMSKIQPFNDLNHQWKGEPHTQNHHSALTAQRRESVTGCPKGPTLKLEGEKVDEETVHVRQELNKGKACCGNGSLNLNF